MISPEYSSKAREILESRIEKGRASAMSLFEKVQNEVPGDSIVKGLALNFVPADKGVVITSKAGGVRSIHKHALGQLASRAGVPSAYLAELNAGQAWQRELASNILNTHYHQGEPNSRYLVRAVKDEVRGVLSDKYRRLDSRPLMGTFIDEVSALGAIPIDGTFSDTRVAMKAILPTLYEPVPGEVLAFGIEWGNSDFGAGMHAVRAFMLRVWCLNGATMENALGQVHLGRQLSDDIELSQRTYELDTRTSISALRDVVRGTLAPRRVEQLCAGIKRAQENQVDWKNVSTSLGKRLLKGELEAAKNAFESEDTINLPAGNSMWRVSNAISWIAGKTDDADRKLELQRIAGEVVDGRKDRVAA